MVTGTACGGGVQAFEGLKRYIVNRESPIVKIDNSIYQSRPAAHH